MSLGFNNTAFDHLCWPAGHMRIMICSWEIRQCVPGGESPSTKPRNFCVFGQIVIIAYKECIKPLNALWRIAASKHRCQMARTAKIGQCSAKEWGLLTIDQSEICHRRGKPKPLNKQPLLPLLGDHGAETEVKYVNRLGGVGPRSSRESGIKERSAGSKKLCTHFASPSSSFKSSCKFQTFTI